MTDTPDAGTWAALLPAAVVVGLCIYADPMFLIPFVWILVLLVANAVTCRALPLPKDVSGDRDE